MPRERKLPARLRDSADPDEIDDEHMNQTSPVSPVKKSKKDPIKDSLPMYQSEVPRSPVKNVAGADMMPPSALRMVPDMMNSKGGIVYPCGICTKEVDDNDDAILCDECSIWYHRICTGLTSAAYDLLTTEECAEWVCDNCILTKNIPLVKLKRY